MMLPLGSDDHLFLTILLKRFRVMKERMLALAVTPFLFLAFTVAAANTHYYPVQTTSPKGSAIAPRLQGEDTAYLRVITDRAGKIVAKLGIGDTARALRVRAIIVQQYSDLNDLDHVSDTTGRAAKTIGLHAQFVARLSKELSPEQVDGVKDGLTYGVLPLTYKAYLEEIPTLTDAQKAQIMTWLTEAREYAMDAGSSKEKHAWFGKYKGRINNYLSKEGYDMKKEETDWMQRIKDRQQAAKNG
jgi:hypothetical protein